MRTTDDNSFVQTILDKTAGLMPRLKPSHLWASFMALVHQHLPERQVHIRTKGKVQYLAISPMTQFGALVAGLLAVCWVGVASANLIFGDSVLGIRENQIADLHQDKQSLEEEIRHLRNDIIVRTKVLEDRQRFVDDLLTTVMPATIQPEDGTNRNKVAGPARLEGGDGTAIGGPEEITPTEAPDSANQSKSDELSNLELRQTETLERIASYVALASDVLVQAIGKTGLDSAEIVTAAIESDNPVGGPLMLTKIILVDDLPKSWSVSDLMENSRQLEALRYTVKNLPLAQPVIDEHYISSRYGGRRDPFKKSWAFHGGLDIAGHWKSPVRATAGGIVTFVGRMGAYGRMIEIDHQNGFRTRYGHLATILVKRGDTVGLTDKIGLMGNSGRSTGTHLHYEIRYRGKPLNPSKFFKAAQHVQTI